MTIDDLTDPECRNVVAVAVRLLKERCARGVASPVEQLAVVALAEQPDEGDEAAVRVWQPSPAFRAAVRLVAAATLARYIGVVEALADEEDRDDDSTGETMH